MRDGNTLIGWGLATATYPTNRMPAAVGCACNADGTVLVQCGTQDIGTGTYTIDDAGRGRCAGLPLERVRFELGDSNLPPRRFRRVDDHRASVARPLRRRAQAVRDKMCDLALADRMPDGRHRATVAAGRRRGGRRRSGRVAIADLLGRSGQPFDRGERAGRSPATKKQQLLAARVRRAVRRGADRSGSGHHQGQPLGRRVRLRRTAQRQDRAQPVDRRHRFRDRHGADGGNPDRCRNRAASSTPTSPNIWCR